MENKLVPRVRKRRLIVAMFFKNFLLALFLATFCSSTLAAVLMGSVPWYLNLAAKVSMSACASSNLSTWLMMLLAAVKGPCYCFG